MKPEDQTPIELLFPGWLRILREAGYRVENIRRDRDRHIVTKVLRDRRIRLGDGRVDYG